MSVILVLPLSCDNKVSQSHFSLFSGLSLLPIFKELIGSDEILLIVSSKIAKACLCMCSFLRKSCSKTQSCTFYLKTVNIQNEMDTRKAGNKAKNYISLLLKVTFWWYTFEKISQYPAVSYLVIVLHIFNVYIYHEKSKLFSAIPSMYKKINIVNLSYQFNNLGNSNQNIETFNVITVSTPPPFCTQGNIFEKTLPVGINNFCLRSRQ